MKTKPKILIVEDEQIIAEDIQRTLKNFGYTVSSIVSSGREAIKDVKENKPDLVLMDIKLRGDIDGVEASEKIQARFDIPIIYITALADDDTLQRAKITKPFGYIHKPIEEKELNSTIEIALFKHEMERKLIESEARYRSLFEDSRDSIYITTQEGKLVDCNQSMLDLFGYTREEMIGMDVQKQYVDPVARQKFQDKIEEKGFVRDYEVKLRKKDGRELDCLLTSSVRRDKDGSIFGYQGSIHDITERKRAGKESKNLQAQLIQAEKMAGIGTLASGVAHEFNNLLQIIRGHMEFVQKTKRQEDMEEAIDIVIYNADRAAKIIRDLLAFSRQEEPEKKLCDIIEPIESVLSLVEEHIKKHNIEVVRKYGKVPLIEMNKAELQQVFLNMVTNARDAMLPEGGRLEVMVNQIGGNVEVRISDTGKGIVRENLNKVFEPFYTTKGAAGGESELQGTGLGLSLSYGIVKRHGGMIEVESKVGKGTAFTIKLPIKKGKTEERSEEKREIEKREVLNVLVVDDEEAIGNMLTKWLSAEKYRVKSALSGKEAINLVKDESFDVVFLDNIMPGIAGVDILEEIKKISPESKVVMITGKFMDKDLIQELRKKGASSFLQKPFKIKDIMETIKGEA